MNKIKKQFLFGFLTIFIITGIAILFSTNAIINVNGSSENISQNKADEEDNILEVVSLDGYLFVGDSYTFLLKETIKEFNPNAIISAKSGVQPSYWNENFSTLPDNEDINGVVLLIGVNGVTYDDNLPNKKKLIDSLVEKYKDKTIYVQKVFPVGENFTNANPDKFNAAIKSHNEEIENYCKKYNNVVFIDATNDLVTEDGYLKYTEDGLHISSDYQDIFYLNIEDAIFNSN